MDLALRIRTDLGHATQEVTQLDAAVDKLGAAGKQASTGLTALGTATDRSAAAHRQHAAAVKSDAAALTDIERKAARAGISVGQYGMAMRMLPAQMTDIGVGIATGQSPFMVLMQQGGQLKDSFGGIVPAAQAVGGSVAGLINPFTLGAAVIGGFAIAAYQAGEEVRGLDSAIIMLGGQSGGMALTVSMLQDMAYELDKVDGVTMSSAIEALEQVAATGQFTAEQIELIGTAAERMRVAGSGNIEQLIAAFEKLRKDPVKALLELNRTQNFLTQEQLKHIETLVAQERQQDAVTEAFRLYAGVIEERTPRIGQNVNWLVERWRDLKRALAETYDGAKDLFRTMPDAQRAVELQQKINYLRSTLGTGHEPYADTEGQIARLQGELDALNKSRAQAANAPSRTVNSEREEARIAAQKKREEERKNFFAAETRYLADTEKKRRDIAAVNDLVTRGVITQEEATKRIAQVEAEYAERAKKRGVEKKSDSQRAEENAARELANLQKEAAMLGAVEDGQKRVSREAAIRYEIESGGYRAASAAAKAALLDAARLVDQRQAERAAEEEKRREFEKTERAYDQLRATLRTPAEVAVETTIERIKTLNDAIKQGSTDAAAYGAQLDKIVDAAFTAPPTFSGLSPEIGGVDSEQYRLQQQKDTLETWYTDQLSRLAQFRQERADLNAQWDAQELVLHQQHAQALATLNQAQNQLLLQQSAAAFDSMAQVAKAYGGEQSRTYRVLFAISKGFAVAQAAIALAQNVAEASKAGFPQNIGFIAGALAQGAQIASLLSAAQYASGGRITGPGTGTSDDVPLWGSAGEFMVRHAAASQPGAYAFLEDFNQRGMAALDDWRQYADGGVITAGAEPRGQFDDGGGRGLPVNLQNAMRLYLYQDIDALRSAILNHPDAEKMMVATIGENRGPVEASWSY